MPQQAASAPDFSDIPPFVQGQGAKSGNFDDIPDFVAGQAKGAPAEPPVSPIAPSALSLAGTGTPVVISDPRTIPNIRTRQNISNPSDPNAGWWNLYEGAKSGATLASIPAAVATPPAALAAGIAGGVAGGAGGKAVAKAVGGGPRAQEVSGDIAGLLTGAAASTLATWAPNTFAKIGGKPSVTPPAEAVPVTPPAPPQPNPRLSWLASDDPAAHAASAMNEQTAAEATAARAVQGIPEPTPPPPPPPEPPPSRLPGPEVTPEHLNDIASAIVKLPPNARAEATMEVVENMGDELVKKGKVLGPDGKAVIVKTQEDGEKVAVEWLNDLVEQHDKLAEETARAEAKPKTTQSAPKPEENVIAQAKGLPQVKEHEAGEILGETPEGRNARLSEIFSDIDEFVKETESGKAKEEPSPTTEGGQRKTGRDVFAKGDRVQLEDGRKATVVYASPSDPFARVQLDEGGKVAKGITKLTKIEAEAKGETKGTPSKEQVAAGGGQKGAATPASGPAGTVASGASDHGKENAGANAGGATGGTEANVPKYKYGNTQAPIPEGSEAHAALASAREQISDFDLAGKGKETEAHVTVRYGHSGDTTRIEQYLSQQEPFEATLGKTEKFEPTEHSDGAAVIKAPIESPDLKRMNGELKDHGEFTEPNFPYSAHATIAYVKPEKADRYVGMSVTHGKKFKIDRVAITDRHGNQKIVKLEGKKKAVATPQIAPIAGYGPPKTDFAREHGGKVPHENLGFNPHPAEDFGNKARAEVERRMGGALPRGTAEKRKPTEGESLAPTPTPAEKKRHELGLPPERGKVGEMRTSDLRVAPHRFQYKMSTDAEGVGTLLKETKVFNPDLAGVISVWHDPEDGKTYVVNGHHRYELAKRLGHKALTVRHIIAKDAATARAIGALQNIADGRGTALDAAKFFRDSGATPERLAESGISMGEKTAADGVALARLDPAIFSKVVAGDLRQGRAIAIGEATDDPAEQKAILALVERKERGGVKVSDEVLSELIRLVKGSEQATETTADLFGSQQIMRSLALEKAEISAYIKQRLSADKKLFGYVAKEGRATELERAGNKIDVEKSRNISVGAAQAEEVYNRLSARGGPIASILDEAARKLADGGNAGEIKSDAYTRVRAEVSKTLGEPTGRGAERLEGAPTAEPDTGTSLFHAETELSPPFYSKAARIAFDKLPGSMSGESALATLKNAGVKADEIKWIGLDDFLKDKTKVSKGDVLSYILKNMVQVKEVAHGGLNEMVFREGFETRGDLMSHVMGDEMLWNRSMGGLKPGLEVKQDAAGKWNLLDRKESSVKYASYTLPGKKKNYTEALLTLPRPPRKVMDTIAHEMGFDGWTNALTEEQKDKVIRAFDRQPGVREPFKSAHWGETNILAHIRSDDRVDADGKRVLFVEEVQSDWHQKGKKLGYQSGEPFPEWPSNYSQWALARGMTKEEIDKTWQTKDPRFLEWDKASKDAFAARSVEEKKVPNAPFKSDWHELAMKTVLRKAAEGGYDRIGWVTGAQTADRYDLAKHVDEIRTARAADNGKFSVTAYRLNSPVFKKFDVEEKDLPDYVGKDLATKIAKLEPGKTGSYSGLDLKTGGEWAKALYDRAIPNFLNKYGKKWGAKVGTTTLPAENGKWEKKTETGWESTATPNAKVPAQTVHSLDITPEMRRSVLSEGQPLFSSMPWPISADTAKGIEFEVKDPGHDLPRYLRVNQNAADAIGRAAGHPIRGVSIPPKFIPEMMTRLKAEADGLDADRRPEAARQLRSLADALAESADKYAGAVVVKARKNAAEELEILHEELFHGAVQQRLGKGIAAHGVPYEQMRGDPGIEKMRARIEEEVPAPFNEVKLVAEAAADLAVGTYDELTADEAEATSEKYYTAVAEAHGAVPLEAARSLFSYVDELAISAGIIQKGEQFNVDRNGPNRRALARVLGSRRGTPEGSPGVQQEPGVRGRGTPGVESGRATTGPTALERQKLSQPSARADDGTATERPPTSLAGKLLRQFRERGLNARREVARSGEEISAGENQTEPRSGAARSGAPASASSRAVEGSGKSTEGTPTSLHAAASPGLTDEELETWSKSKGFRIEPAGEQLGMFGGNEPVMRVFRSARGKEESGLVYQTQLDKLQEKTNEPLPEFSLTGGEAKEEQPRLFGAGDLGEVIGNPKAKSGIKLPFRSDQTTNLFSSEKGELSVSKLAQTTEGAIGTLAELFRTEIDLVAKSREIQSSLYDLEPKFGAAILRAIPVMQQVEKSLGKEAAAIKGPVYEYLEDPENTPLNDKQDDLLDNIVLPIMEKNNDLAEELRGDGFPEDQIANYVHRVVKGKGGWLDRVVEGAKRSARGNPLSKSAPQLKGRTMMALEKKGDNLYPERMVVSLKGGQVTAWKSGSPTNLGAITNARDGRFWKDKDGTEWKLTQATTKEIEANTDLKYFHDPVASAIVSNLQLTRTVLASRAIDAILKDPDFQSFGFKEEKDLKPPEGWQRSELGQVVPSLRDYYWEPHVREVLDWQAARMRQEGGLGLLDNVDRVFRLLMLVNPIAHPLNVMASWAFEKGVQGALPWRAISTAKTGVRALRDVLAKNENYAKALEAGGAMQSWRQSMGDITQLFFRSLSDDIESKDAGAIRLAKAIGFIDPDTGKPSIPIMQQLHRFSSKAAWLSSDVFLLQSAYEKMERYPKMTLEEALKETQRFIPDYRLPTRMFDSKQLASLLSNRKLTYFMAYHYGLLKSFGENAKSMAGLHEPPGGGEKPPSGGGGGGRAGGGEGRGPSKGQEAAEAWGRAAMLYLIPTVLLPLLTDRALKMLTGNPNAKLRRPGPFGVVDNLTMVAHGERTPTQGMMTVVSPNPFTEMGGELFFNRELRTGRTIYDPNAHASDIASQLGNFLLDAVPNVGEIHQDFGNRERLKNFLLRQAQVVLPKSPAEIKAAQIAAENAPTKAWTSEQRDAYYARERALEALRNGDDSVLEEEEAAGKLSKKQVHELRKDAKLTPLQQRVKGFTYGEALDVMEKATPDEQADLQPIIDVKRKNALHAGKAEEVDKLESEHER